MESVSEIQFSVGVSGTSDPQKTPVLIVGKLKNLRAIKFQDVAPKIEKRVSEEVFKAALESLHPSTSDTVSLYLGLAHLASLPAKASRHNSSAHPHALSSIVKATSTGREETIIVVCEYVDILASAVAIGRSYPLYNRKSNRSRANTVVHVNFIVVGPHDPTKISIEAITLAAEAVRTSARIVDTPCSEMNVEDFLLEIKHVSEECNLEMKVIRGEELFQKGLHGIYGVGKAAHVKPALAVLTYKGTGSGPSIAWVGKGIVYDTGGLSIKGKLMMPGMKRDCGGAAAILGAMWLASKLGFKTTLHAVFCLAENSVGPESTRPDDIHTLYSGRTVEINNTDAEGRLVLADGVTYAAKDLNAEIILDMATLTGAQGIATGKYHAAVLSNSEMIEEASIVYGRMSGDLTFPIPFAPELHFPEFNSSLADMKNSVGDRANAQPSCAGLFIMAHLGFDFPGTWVHIDMASPAHCGERATGYGVALLILLFSQFSKDPMIAELNTLATELCPSNKLLK